MKLARSTSLPVRAKLPIRPGCGKSTRSGTLPASTRVEIVASNCFELSYWMSMPVFSSNALTFSLNFTSSAPAKAPKAVTLVPLNLPASASVNSAGMSAAITAWPAAKASMLLASNRTGSLLVFIFFLLGVIPSSQILSGGGSANAKRCLGGRPSRVSRVEHSRPSVATRRAIGSEMAPMNCPSASLPMKPRNQGWPCRPVTTRPA